jgi:hypothetical protein
MAMTRARAKQITYKSDATGAAVVNLHDKLGESVSVKDFGAVGDGVADDTAAIQAACLTGKKVLFPRGIYLVGSTIALTSAHAGCGFVLDGATIRKGFNGDLVTVTGCADFTVTGDGKVEGQSATYSGKGFVFSGIGAIYPEFGPGITIQDFADAHIEIGADAAMYLKTYARILTPSSLGTSASELAIDIKGTDTSARQRSIYGEIIGYVRLAGTISTFIKPTIVTRVEIASTCSITLCNGFTWSNGNRPMTIDGFGTVVIGCRFSGDVTLAATMSGVFKGNIQTGGTFTNNSGAIVESPLGINFGSAGSSAAPSYTFTTDPDTGLWRRGSNLVDVSTGGVTTTEFQNSSIVIGSNSNIKWGTSALIPDVFSYDTSLFRGAAGVVVAGTGGILTGSVGAIVGKLHPRTDAGAYQVATGFLGGSGAPNNANGINGDFYFRADGGALTTIYHKRAGSWVGVV